MAADPSCALSRADLLRALQLAYTPPSAPGDIARNALAASDAALRYADLLDFEPRPIELPPPLSDKADIDATMSSLVQAIDTKLSADRPPLQASFFVISHYDKVLASDAPAGKAHAPSTQTPAVQPLSDEDCAPRGLPLAFQPLVRRERLWPRLRQSLQQNWSTGIDLPRLLQQVATRRLPSRVPVRERRGLSRQVVVLWDAADRLTPYAEDYRRLVAELHRLHGAADLRMWRVFDGPDNVLAEWDVRRVATPARYPGEAWEVPVSSAAGPAGRGLPRLAPGTQVLLLSDLGNLASHAGPTQRWLGALQRWAQSDVRVTAWLPHGARWVPPALAAWATELHCLTHRLERVRRPRQTGTGAGSLALMHQAAGLRRRQDDLRELLLVRASVCVHLEPQLLRSLRQGVPELAAEPGVEALAWTHQPVVRSSHVSRALAPEHAPRYRQAFAALPVADQWDVLERLTAAHASLGRSTEVTEVLLWAAHAHGDARSHERVRPVVESRQRWVLAWNQRMQSDAMQGQPHPQARHFAADMLARVGQDDTFVCNQAAWASHLTVLANRDEVPAGLTPGDLLEARKLLHPKRELAELQDVWISTKRSELRVVIGNVGFLDSNYFEGPFQAREVFVDLPDGRRKSLIGAFDRYVVAHAGQPGQRITLHLDEGQLDVSELDEPIWASEWGVEKYGLYADMEVNGIKQRMRYISPGSFMMGSPEGVGRDDEHPKHPVTLTEGYWLADTPCTQALWQAVIGVNPSEFKEGPDAAERPVENVSWDDLQTFLQRLRNLLPPGCEPTLPTETQWEFAARAGTSTAYWWGDEAGDTCANWGQQHEGTTPVRRFAPNPWGLHDVHGNVWEWCLDDKRAYASDPVRDPRGDLESSRHAVRGGSWLGDPGRARSAYRHGWRRDDRYQARGFRLSLRSPGPVPGAGGPGHGDGEFGKSAQLVVGSAAGSGKLDYLSYVETILKRQKAELLQNAVAQTPSTKELYTKSSFAGKKSVPSLPISTTKSNLNTNLGRPKRKGRR
jgi:formylglycine-generating enzyme required for sulfatase activity